VAVLLVLAIGGWFVIQRSLDGAFAHFDLSPLETIAKKGVADLVVIKRLSRSTSSTIRS